MTTSVTAPVDLQARIVTSTLMTARPTHALMGECAMTKFKAILVSVKLDSKEKIVKLQSMNANLHLVSMEHAPTYLMTTNAHATQDILVEIVQC